MCCLGDLLIPSSCLQFHCFLARAHIAKVPNPKCYVNFKMKINEEFSLILMFPAHTHAHPHRRRIWCCLVKGLVTTSILWMVSQVWLHRHFTKSWPSFCSPLEHYKKHWDLLSLNSALIIIEVSILATYLLDLSMQ